MRTQTPKKNDSSETSLIYQLIQCGYSEPKAINLYNKYKNWDKLDNLKNYVEQKLLNPNTKSESYIFRDI